MNELGFLEKKMEQWLATNPNAVLPEDERQVLVISQETPFENMTDVIAVDQAGNLIVIEVKRGQTPRDVIAQALEYASDVATWDYETLNKKAVRYFKRNISSYASLLDAFSQTFGSHVSESKFNQQQRIVIVAEKIDEKIERTARWLMNHGVSISCVGYTCYQSDEQEKQIFLDLDEVVHPIAKRRPGIPVSEDEIFEYLPDSLRKILLELKQRVLRFGPDVQTTTTKSGCLIFKASKNFAEIYLQSREMCLRFNVRGEGFKIPENCSAQVHGVTVTRVPDSHGWTLNHWFKVNHDSSLDAITELLRQSYDAVQEKI
jgi:predicted transport protein